jgi:hypothetical protein
MCMKWFCNVETYIASAIEYWIILFLKIHLNQNWKFKGDWGVFLILLENLSFEKCYGGDTIILKPKMWEILNFEWILSLRIQLKLKIENFQT